MENRIKWLKEPNIRIRFVLVFAVLWSGFLFVFSESGIYHNLENKVGLPFYFKVREMLDRSPILDAKIKILAFDDKTVADLRQSSLNDRQWVDLLRAVDEKKPSVILIDGLFSLSTAKEADLGAPQVLENLQELQAKVVVGAYVTPAVIPYRAKISHDSPGYDLTSYIEKPRDADGSLAQIAEGVKMPDATNEFVYGPDVAYREYLKYFGHLLYKNDGLVAPFIRLGPTKVLPHIVSMAIEDVKFYRGSLYMNSRKVPTDRGGFIPINFSSPAHYFSQSRSLRSFFKPHLRDKLLEWIEPGDIVFIIPNLFTGSTDFKVSPFGSIPGAFSHLGILNSAVTGNWLEPLRNPYYLLLVSSLIGAVAAIKVGWLGFSILIVAATVGWIIAALTAFTLSGILFPLISPVFAFYGPLLFLFAQKSLVAEKKAQYVRYAFEGSVEPSKLDTIARHPGTINFEARERVVTIMFIDVVGFSLLAEHQQPRVAFDTLKNVLTKITETIHEFGGIVNKNLGDGLLCFFGYSLDTDESSFDHAEKALACAVEIQRKNVPDLIACYENNEDIYPLRIGINTASVFLGNIGTGDRLDFTVVGNGVNFAKRLEGACGPHSVLIGSTTKDLISPFAIPMEGFEKRAISIKHHEEKVEAWQFNPFHDLPEIMEKAKKMLKIIRESKSTFYESRSKIEKKIYLQTDFGIGSLINLVPGGLTLALDKPIEAKQTIELFVRSEDGALQEQIRRNNIESVSTAVIWSIESEGRFTHNLKFKNLSLSEIKVLSELLLEYGYSHSRESFDNVSHNPSSIVS